MTNDILRSGEKPPFYAIWLRVLTRPKADRYRELLDVYGSSVRDAYVWVMGCEIFAAVLFSTYWSTYVKDHPAQTLFNYLVYPALLFTVQVFITHVVSWLFGGRGAFSDLAYLMAAYFAPLFALKSLADIFVGMRGTGLELVLLPVAAYETALCVVAAKAVYGFKTGKAILCAVVIPGLIIFATFFVATLLLSL